MNPRARPDEVVQRRGRHHLTDADTTYHPVCGPSVEFEPGMSGYGRPYLPDTIELRPGHRSATGAWMFPCPPCGYAPGALGPRQASRTRSTGTVSGMVAGLLPLPTIC